MPQGIPALSYAQQQSFLLPQSPATVCRQLNTAQGLQQWPNFALTPPPKDVDGLDNKGNANRKRIMKCFCHHCHVPKFSRALAIKPNDILWCQGQVIGGDLARCSAVTLQT